MPSETQDSGGDVLDALDVALLVAAALDRIGAEYFVGGSVASSLQGEPRATNDIDFVLAMMAWRVPALAAALGADFEVDQEALREAITTGRCANIFYLPLVMKVDLFGVGSTPYDEVEFSRRRRVRVKSTGEELFVKSPEDTVLRKLLWYREGGEVSTKQWRDVVEVLRVSGPQIDPLYLDAWAARLGVAALLSRARAQATGGGPSTT
ncbi:MAG TPA: hypothetical protein VLS89_02810 [Candidatus Nanopelagicales bacterium]|nr:hypothetical protein [Candidatus Nanopelagicales bacterium]